METFFKTTADLLPSVDHLCILTFEMSPKFDRCRRRQYQSNSLFQVFEIWISKLSREISIQFWDFLKFQQLNSGLMQNVKKIVSFNYDFVTYRQNSCLRWGQDLFALQLGFHLLFKDVDRTFFSKNMYIPYPHYTMSLTFSFIVWSTSLLPAKRNFRKNWIRYHL